MKRIILFFSILYSYCGFGTVDSLITNHSSWRFLDNGSNQGTAWTALSINESAWGTGTTILGYGDVDTDLSGHQVGYGGNPSNKYITTYFRKHFTLSNPVPSYSSLNLSLISDDGAVVYLNGTEIYRQNMPASSNYLTLAPATSDPERVWINANLNYANLLVAGDNVIAVEVHQNAVNSSDLAMNLLLAANVIPPPAGDSLVTNHSSWRFLDNGSNQGTAWTAISINESAWGTGTTILGYGDVDTDLPGHQIGYGGDPSNKYITTYFRKHFTLSNPIPSYSSLNLSLISDDGAVVYLNGTEIYRQNMPASSDYTTLALTASDPERAWIDVTLNHANLLVAGDNVIAVEVHQNTVNSSDIAMNLLLKGIPSSNIPIITRGPYLQMINTTSAVVRWQTAYQATNSKVSYGLTTSYTSPPVTNAALTTEHSITLTGLTPNTKYFYQIGTTTVNFPNVPVSGLETYFKTALPAGTTADFTVWTMGDFGRGNQKQLDVKQAYLNYTGANKADFWVMLGDNAYENGSASEYTTKNFNVYPEILKNTPVVPILGNHDYANYGDSMPGTTLPLPYPDTYEYFNAYTVPTNGELGGVASSTKRYYSYNYGNVHFIVLDSYGVVTNNTTNPMYLWLQSDLAANTKKWTVCFVHHAPYSKGTHDSDDSFGMKAIRENFLPLLESYSVDLVLSGHSHVYERSFLLKGHYGVENTLLPSMKINSTQGNTPPYYTKNSVNGIGTVYVVCGIGGDGGTPPNGINSSWPHNAMAVSYNDRWGSMLITFESDTIVAKLLSSTGSIDDSFKIVKSSCVPTSTIESVTSGDWNTASTWGCGTIPTTGSMVTIKAGHTVTLNANTYEIKKIYILGTLKYLNNSQLKLQH